jgi:hypothetical protein
VCTLLGASTDCSSSYHNMRGKEVPYKQNHSCGTHFTLTLQKLPTIQYVPKLELRNPMRDGTITRLWYLRSEQISNLSRRSTRIIVVPLLLAALEMGPICNQDCNADACGIPRAGVPYEKGLSGAIRWWRERGNGGARDCVYVCKGSVDVGAWG